MPHKLRKELEELVEETYRVLRCKGRRVEIIWYPQGSSKALDLISVDKEKRIFIRIVYDSHDLGRGGVLELKATAKMLNASPIVVSAYVNGFEAEEDVIYERHGLNVVSVTALKNIVNNDENLYIYNVRGTYTIKIDPIKLKKKREELGLSLGDVANLLGVSRKTVYEYEKGTMNLSIEKAARLVEVFGEEILEPVELFKEPRLKDNEVLSKPDTKLEEEIITFLEKHGFHVCHLRRTPIDVLAKSGNKIMSIILKHLLSSRRFRLKINEAEKIIRATNIKGYIVSSEDDIKEIKHDIN